MSYKLVLLDRDGVVNRKMDEGYVNSLEDFIVNLEIFDFLRFLDAQSIKTAIITNQQGLAKGVTNFLNFHLIQGTFAQECIQRNAVPPQLFYCPHLEGTCECRKPKTGLLRGAMSTFNVHPEECILIGDSDSDIECAQKLGILSIHFRPGTTCNFNCNAALHANNFENLSQLVKELIT